MHVAESKVGILYDGARYDFHRAGVGIARAAIGCQMLDVASHDGLGLRVDGKFLVGEHLLQNLEQFVLGVILEDEGVVDLGSSVVNQLLYKLLAGCPIFGNDEGVGTGQGRGILGQFDAQLFAVEGVGGIFEFGRVAVDE